MAKILERMEAEICAREIGESSGMSAFPVDPFQIARQEKIELYEMPHKTGVSGMLVKSGDSFTIGYSIGIQNKAFQRFTVAHELGHYFLPGHSEQLFAGGNGCHKSQAEFSSGNQWERQADYFAAALLMPERQYEQALRDAGDGLPAIEHMASLCQTSLTATAIRYATFADDPVLVVLSDGRKIRYADASSPIQNIMPKRDLWLHGQIVPPSSCTAAFGKNASLLNTAQRKEGYCSLSDWIVDAPDIEMKEDSIGLGGYGSVLTILFTDEAIEEDD